MNFEEPPKIHPEDDHEEILKSRINIDAPPVKKKRRFFYYFLSMFLTFVIARAVLVLIVCYTLDFDKLIYNKLYYDSKTPLSFSLDISIQETYSPCFVQIKDIECSVFRVNQEEEQRHLMDLDIPDIEIIKFKTLTFKDKVSVENIVIGDPIELFHSKYFVGKVKCKLYFRFCLIKWYRTLNLEKKIHFWEDRKEPKWDFLKSVDIKKDDEGIKVHYNINTLLLIIPPWIEAFFSKVEIVFNRDVPVSLFIDEQKIVKGRFETSLAGYLLIRKENYTDILRTIIKWSKQSLIFLGVDNVITNGRDHFMDICTVLNRQESEEDKFKNLQTNPIETNKEPPKRSTPYVIFDHFNLDKNEFSFIVQLNSNRVPLLAYLGKLSFEGVAVHSKILFYESVVGRGRIEIVTEGNIVTAKATLTILDIQKPLDSLTRGGKLDFKLQLGTEDDKHPLLKDLVLHYNASGLILKHEGNVLYKAQANESYSTFSINHSLLSSGGEISIISKCDLPLPSLSLETFAVIKKLKIPLDFENEFFKGAVNVGLLNFRVCAGGNVTGNIHIFTELSPRPAFYEDPSGFYLRVPNPDFKLSANGDSVIYNYKHNLKFADSPDNTKPFKLKIVAEYVKSKDLFNHTFKFGVKADRGSHDALAGKSRLLHNVSIPDDLIGLNLYTKNFPFTDDRPNVTVKASTIKLPLNEEGLTIDAYLSDYQQLKSVLYGDFYLFSTKNVLSYAIAQYFNGLRMQPPDYSNRSIFAEPCVFNLQIDGVTKDSQPVTAYNGSITLAVPHQIANSFIISFKPLPRLLLRFISEDAPTKSNSLIFYTGSDTHFAFLRVDFQLDFNLLQSKGQTVTWSIGKETGRTDNSFTISTASDSLILLFRMFFYKMLEPPVRQQATENCKMGLFVGHDKFKDTESSGTKGDGVRSLNTNVEVVLYADPMETFFTKTIPKIFLGLNFKILPKFFVIKMKSDRLDLLNLKVFGVQRGEKVVASPKDDKVVEEPKDAKLLEAPKDNPSEALKDNTPLDTPKNDKIPDEEKVCLYSVYAENAECEAKFLLDYQSKLPSGLHDIKRNDEKPKQTLYVPERILNNTGKLIFHGNLVLKYSQTPELYISSLKVDCPFPFFLVDIMKQNNQNNLAVFVRGAILDFAIGLPFSLGVEAKEKLKYEIIYNDIEVIKDDLIGDQGDDKYLHLCFDGLNKDVLLPALLAFTKGDKFPFTLKISQGEEVLIENKFNVEEDLYKALHQLVDTILVRVSKSASDNADLIIGTLSNLLGV